MLRSKMIRVGMLAVPIVFALAAHGQEPPPLIQVARVTVKPDRAPECREITKRFTEAHKKGGGEFRHVWRNRLHPFQYIVITPSENYAAFDAPGPDQKGMSEGERAALVARRRNCTESVELTIRRPIPELSIPGSSAQPPAMVTTATAHVRAGMVEQYIERMKEFVDAMKKAGIKGFGGHQIMWGGKRTTIVTWAALDKMEGLDSRALLARSMGEEARSAWIERGRAMIETGTDWDIWVYEPNLSHYSAP